MKTITLEEHFITPEFYEATSKTRHSGDSHEYPQLLREKLLDIGKSRIADMDAGGVQMQVLSPTAAGIELLDSATATALAKDVNDKLAAATTAHPDRLAGWATVALQDPESAAAEFERCIHKLKFKGLLVNGTVGGLFLDDKRFTTIFETAQKLDVPIYVHPGVPPKVVRQLYYDGFPAQLSYMLATAGWGWHTETAIHSLRLILSGIFDRFPKLKVIIGHMGEGLPFFLARSEAILGNAQHLKRSLGEYFREHFYITTSGMFTLPPFLCALEVLGADRILYSVDYPFSPCTNGQKFLSALPVSPSDLEKITHRNAEELLRL